MKDPLISNKKPIPKDIFGLHLNDARMIDDFFINKKISENKINRK
jgi:hypothetical protein